MSQTPTDIAQEALDAGGIEYTIGDIEEGTRPAQVLLRRYRECLKQLLRAAMWDFARKSAPLTLLADSTGQTPNVGTQVQGNQFLYEYAYPTDAVRLRYVPWCPLQNPGAPAGNIVPPNNNQPLMPGLNQAPALASRVIPARFLISNDPNYPPPPGSITWEVQGVSPQGRVVILTNVQNANGVYTYLALYPSVWDALFREAMVAYLASEIVMPLHTDKKFALEMRKEQQAIAKDKILAARAIDGNEMWASSSVKVNWLDTRYVGAAGWWGWNAMGGAGPGGFWGGYGDCCGAGSVEGNSAY